MGAPESEKAIAQQKIDDDGLSSDSDFDGCRGRFCSSNRRHILRDVLRGILVLTVLGIIVTVIFLLCFFLIQEKQDEKLIDDLINELSDVHEQPTPEFSIGTNESPPSNDVGPTRGDVGGENGKLLDGREKERRKEGPFPAQRPEESRPILDRQELEGRGGALPDPAMNKPFGEDYRVPSELTPEDEAFLSFDEFVPVGVQTKPQEPVQEEPVLRMPSKAKEEIFKSLPEELPGGEFGFEIDDMPPPVIISSEKRCEELRLPLCAGSMPWAMTAFPNWVNNTNRQHLHESLQYFQSVVVGSQCSPRGLEYSCAILEPPCGPDEVPLPPCRQFCRDVSRSCSEFLVEGHSHNGVFNCDIFPDSEDPSICVNVRRPAPNSTPEPQPEVKEEPAGPHHANVDLNRPKALIPGEAESPQEISPVENNSEFALTGEEAPVDFRLEEDAPIERSEQGEILLVEEPSTRDQIPLQEATDNLEHSEVPEEEYADLEEPMVCDHSLFLCEDGSDCFSYDQVCNGIQECLDNSDEFNCTQTEVIETQNVDLGRDTDAPSLLRRPSLSEMLSSSAIVASPQLESKLESMNEQSNAIKPVLRVPPSAKLLKKSPDLVSVSSQTSFSALDTSQDEVAHAERGQSKMTLADLLSSSVASKNPQLASKQRQELFALQKPSRRIEPAQHLSASPQRSLSHILSSSFSSFRSRSPKILSRGS